MNQNAANVTQSYQPTHLKLILLLHCQFLRSRSIGCELGQFQKQSILRVIILAGHFTHHVPMDSFAALTIASL